jgi:deazaflavin-dependent oxidoreductase (nitroreductase family)
LRRGDVAPRFPAHRPASRRQIVLLACAAAWLLYVVARRVAVGMHPQDYSRRVAYRPPAAWYRRISNRLGVLLTSLGLAPQDAVTLTVTGRRSGKPRRIPILRTRYQEEDYLVALAGESEWVRNLRAARGLAVIRRRHARPVCLVEIPVDKRPAIISEYLRSGSHRSGVKAASQAARYYFGLNADPAPDEIRAVAEYYPVFRIIYLDGSKDD